MFTQNITFEVKILVNRGFPYFSAMIEIDGVIQAYKKNFSKIKE
jgi:hypothetical protein